MNNRTTTVKRSRAATAPVLKDLDMLLLTPEQSEAITKANYYHPDSRLVLQLFLHVNYSWHMARKIQNKPSTVDTIDWAALEKSAARLISDSLARLLVGVSREPWDVLPPAPPPVSKPARRLKEPVRQACGCTRKHSKAAGVIEACALGKAQGADETWTGY